MAHSDPQKKILSAENISHCLRYCFVPAVMFYVISLLVLSQSGFSLLEVLRDPAQQTKQSSFLGFLSSIGSWLWVSSATLCFFGTVTTGKTSGGDHKRLLLLTGWFSLVLAVDDFFLIHDRYLAEGILLPLYAAFAIYLLVRHRSQIMEIDGFAFFGAATLLALSITVDAIQEIIPVRYEYSQVLEEGFKFVGAATWLYFCFRLAAYHPPVQDT